MSVFPDSLAAMHEHGAQSLMPTMDFEVGAAVAGRGLSLEATGVSANSTAVIQGKEFSAGAFSIRIILG
jgi:hypothetical protein